VQAYEGAKPAARYFLMVENLQEMGMRVAETAGVGPEAVDDQVDASFHGVGGDADEEKNVVDEDSFAHEAWAAAIEEVAQNAQIARGDEGKTEAVQRVGLGNSEGGHEVDAAEAAAEDSNQGHRCWKMVLDGDSELSDLAHPNDDFSAFH
jgi:hypothetical protein